MNSVQNFNTMIMSLFSEYRKVVVSILQSSEFDVSTVKEILESWDAKTANISSKISPILESISGGKKKGKSGGPKRPMSAYIYFCKDKRSEVKEANSGMKATEITKELGMMWQEIKETEEAEQYIELANADKARYIAEVTSGEEGEEGEGKKVVVEKKKREKKNNTGPKKPISAYLFFCKEKRTEVKAENPDMKTTEVTSELGRLWNAIKETPKASKYRKLAEEDKARYMEEVPESKEDGEKKKGGKKLPKNKVEGEKKRAKTGYNLFRQEKVSAVSDEFPDLSKKEIQKKISEMWSSLKETNPEIIQEFNVRAKMDIEEKIEVTTEDENMEQENKPLVEQEDEIMEDEVEQKEEELEDEIMEDEIDSGLVSSIKFMKYLENVKTSMKKRGFKMTKTEFINAIDETDLPDDIVEKVNAFTDSKSKTITVSVLEELIRITQEMIDSYN
jgi:hypothetical protein